MKTRKPARRSFLSLAGALAMAVVVSGCATSGNPKDPLEGFNRAVFALNEGVDTVIIRPAAVGYEAVLPELVRTGVSNFFSNIGDVFIGVNNLLQGKVPDAMNDLGRVTLNSSFGLLGIFDIASSAGLEKHDEDFGQTLGRWGVGNGPYLVLPIFGPRTLRDTGGLILDRAADPVSNLDHVVTRNTFSVLNLVNARASALSADKMIDEAALDKYSYLRDAYLQRRRSLIHDGSPPREPDLDLDAPEPSPPAGSGTTSSP